MATRIKITFHRHDDLSGDAMDRIDGACLTCAELDTRRWARSRRNVILSFTTDDAAGALTRFQEEGFELDEFEGIELRPTSVPGT